MTTTRLSKQRRRNAAKLLRDARALFGEHGEKWARGHLQAQDGRLCAIGGLSMASGLGVDYHYSTTDEAYNDAARALADALPGSATASDEPFERVIDSIVAFNDRKWPGDCSCPTCQSRKQPVVGAKDAQDVIKLFEMAACRLETKR